MAEFNPELDRRAGAEMHALLNVWKAIEQPRKKLQISDDTIDFNTIDPSVEEIDRLMRDIDSRVDFTRKLSEIASKFDPLSEDGEFARARANALKAYIDEVEGRWHYSLDDYLEATLALPKKSSLAFLPVPEITLTDQKSKVVELVSQTGYDFNRDSWDRLVKNERLDQEDIVKAYQQAEERFAPILQDMAHLPERPKYSLIFDEVPGVTWVNWTRGDRSGISLTINMHSDVKDRHIKGTSGANFIHEDTHINEFNSWMMSMDNTMYGTTTIPGPEQGHLEAFANTATFFDDRLADELDTFEKMAVELSLYETWVLRNALISVNTEPQLISQIKDSLMAYLPNRGEVFINRYLQQSFQSPSRRSYNAAYGLSYEHWKWAKQLAGDRKKGIWSFRGSPDRRSELLDYFMKKPRLPVQIYNQVQLLEGARAA